MPHRPTCSRLPRPEDPIRCATDALRVVSLVMHHPLQPETIAFLVDVSGRSDTITVVSGTVDPDSIVSVSECMALVGARVPSLCGLVVATVRPGGHGVLPGDVDRWLDAEAITDAHGIELIDWFVVTPEGVVCPRQVLGEPDRW